MNSEFGRAIARIRNCKPKNSTACDNLPRQVQLVMREQTSWVAWRNAQCDVMAFGMEGRSGEEVVRMDCRTKLTMERTKYLQKVGKD